MHHELATPLDPIEAKILELSEELRRRGERFRCRRGTRSALPSTGHGCAGMT